MFEERQLHAEEILKLEFEYARETAAQAQNDRTIIVNLYLILVGGAGSLLLAAETIAPIARVPVPPQALGLLFFVLGVLGILTLLKLIRLRQAWYQSVRAMNQIKATYLEKFEWLETAFLWKPGTIPPLGKAWSITFVLSLMVILLSSTAFACAMHFFGSSLTTLQGTPLLEIDAIAFGFALLIQLLLYFGMLRQPTEPSVKAED